MNFDRPVLTINLDIIKQNYLSICSLLSERSKVAAVVKADGYGVGAAKIVPCLFAAGCRDFMVSSIEEAVSLRGYLAKIDIAGDANIYVLNGVFDSTKELFCQHKIIPVINSLNQLQIWQNVNTGNRRKTVLHLDTGMNRLGMKGNDFVELCNGAINTSNLDIIMLMSHLSDSDAPEKDTNKLQLEKFTTLCSKFPQSNNTKKCISNSGGVFLGEQYHLDMVRAGAALLGLNTHPEAHKHIKNPLRLAAPIIQVQTVLQGEKIGYSGAYIAPHDMKVATIPVGYADGFHRILGIAGKVYINNKETKIVGRVSMDLMTIDVTHIADENTMLGQEVEIIGKNQTPDQLAKVANSIGYEMLTSLGNRYKRVYT